MKKTLQVNIGGRPFIIDEDAYLTLRQYLDEVGSGWTDRMSSRGDGGYRDPDRRPVPGNPLVTHSGRQPRCRTPRYCHPGQCQRVRRTHPSNHPTPSGSNNPHPDCQKRFYRSRYDRMLGGVCGGIARYYDLDPLLVRIITLVLGVFTGLAILPYIILWIVAPMEPRQITEGTDLKDQ